MPTPDLMTTVGQRIRALREVTDVTQAELAEVTGLARTSITNLEAGRQNIQISTLESLSKHFGIPISALLGEGDLPVLPKVRIETVCVVACERCGEVANNLTPSRAVQLRREHIAAHLSTPEVPDA